MSDPTRLRRRSLVAGAAAATVGATIARPALAQQSVTWRVQSHWPAASSSFKDSLAVLAATLKERTKGRFNMQTFGSGELFKGAEIFNAVRRSVVEMGTISPAYILGEAKTAGIVYGLPGTFRDVWEISHYTKNMGAEKLLQDELLPQGVMIFSEKAYATELVTKKPIKSLADFKGMKLRSAGTLLKVLNEAGAAATEVPATEMYQALSSGVIDGAHWGAAQGAASMSFYEVAKNHYRPPLAINIDAFIISKAAYDKLPADLQLILAATLEERFWRRSAEYLHKEEMTLSKARAGGVQVLRFPPDVEKAVALAAVKVREQERAKGGAATEAMNRMEGFLKELGYAA